MSFRVAVLGATGAVGREMIKILEERDFPVSELLPLATERSAGSSIVFQGREITVTRVNAESFKGTDLALFSAGSAASRQYAHPAVTAGAIVIDNSSAFRQDPQVPLVIPEVNPEDLASHHGLIANPNCSTIQLVMVLKPIYDRFGLERIICSTYQSVSGTGNRAIAELREQSLAVLKGEPVASRVYPHQIAFNVLPHIDVLDADGYSFEEIKMINETRKILHDPVLWLNVTTVRVPVFYGHSESVYLETTKEADIAEIRSLLKSAPGVKVLDNPGQNLYPLAIMSERDDAVMVGRIRRDQVNRRGFNLWIVANNLRKGAALNAVQIAELVARKK
ncbi:MAG: aspartate-semialdehyde dehydrogenase [Candidatus Cloacimonetes bacterium]|nr:aspartate-semialdehyde dehydrogenase [Candidatus Cloacimonadota bacterium]